MDGDVASSNVALSLMEPHNATWFVWKRRPKLVMADLLTDFLYNKTIVDFHFGEHEALLNNKQFILTSGFGWSI